MEDTKVRSVDVDAALVERLERLADEQNRPLEAVLYEALGAYLSTQEEGSELHRELAERWEEYQHTGLHLTAEEADKWMTQVANGERPPLPKAHT